MPRRRDKALLAAAAAAAAAAMPALAIAAETIAYRYDARGRLVKVERTGGVNHGVVTDYGFDKADNRLSKTTTGVPAPVYGTEGNDTLTGTIGNDTIHGLGGTDNIYVDQGGIDTVIGGSGTAFVRFGATYSPQDVYDGGAGIDQLVLRGHYPDLRLTGSLTNVESVVFLPSADPNLDFTYNVTEADANVAAGTTTTFDGGQLTAGERLTFNGAAETDGAQRIYGGADADTLTGGAGNDLLGGNAGADRLTGLGGADTFRTRAGDSSGAQFDTLVGFDERADRIDLPGLVLGFAAPVGQASLSRATFDSDLAAATAGALGPSQAVTVTATSGDLSGRLFLVADGNAIAGFQAGADFVFEIEAPAVPLSGTINFFI